MRTVEVAASHVLAPSELPLGGKHTAPVVTAFKMAKVLMAHASKSGAEKGVAEAVQESA